MNVVDRHPYLAVSPTWGIASNGAQKKLSLLR